MMRISAKIASLAMLATVLATPGRAEDVKAGNLVISQPWARATPGGAQVGGGYLTIENKGTEPDRLLGGTTTIAKTLEIHEMTMNNGVMTMRPISDGVIIDPGKTVKFAPGGYHFMLMQLKGPLKKGGSVPITLKFEKAGEVNVSLSVAGVGAQGPDGAGKPAGGMDMKDMPSHSGMKM